MNRQELIRAMRQKGLTYAKIGRFFGLSKQRIHKLLNPYRLNLTKLTGIVGDNRNRVRELARIRDLHTCQICFKKWKKGQRRFDVHHLNGKYEGLQGKNRNGVTKQDRKNLDKLITLCHKCHLNLDNVRRNMSEGSQSAWTKRNQRKPILVGGRH